MTSFRADPGEIIAITGPTGCGKTTLLRALLGLESVVGRIHYGTEDLASRGVGPGERPFAWVPQEAPIVSGTLVDNVLLGRAQDDDISAVLRSLGADELVRCWKHDRLGATGRPVSGGERKWIALARAIASGLPVLVLDEPTAGLDEKSEARVLDAIVRLRRERTIILVSHERRAIAIADRVVLLGSTGLPDRKPRASRVEGTA